MRIFHYTSIHNLALILDSKAIKFNRLDLVDDLEEAQIEVPQSKIKLGMYEFVSCWTKDAKENIALWKIYTDNKGVRISMDEDMFVTYESKNSSHSYFQSEWDMRDEGILITAMNNEAKLFDIEYTDDFKEKVIETIHFKRERETEKQRMKLELNYNPNIIGIYKSKQWEFQKESRFKIHVLPINNKCNDPIGSATKLICEGKTISRKEFFIKLKDEAIQQMEITMGPHTTKADRILVDSLINKYDLNSIQVIDSSLKGKIRSPYK